MRRFGWRAAAVAGLVVFAVGIAQAAGDDPHRAPSGHMMQSGQSAFAAIAEVVAVLEADPGTDWAKVNLGALREHLVDMNEVVLRAAAQVTQITDGVEIAVLGAGRTRQAIWNMVPAHAVALDALPWWGAFGERTAEGARLRVTSNDSGQVARIQGLGFFGLLATGAHHQVHHLAIARGLAMPAH